MLIQHKDYVKCAATLQIRSLSRAEKSVLKINFTPVVCLQRHIMPPSIPQLIRSWSPEGLTMCHSHTQAWNSIVVRVHKGHLGNTQIPNSALLPRPALTLL